MNEVRCNALCETSICHFSANKKSPFFPLTNERARQVFYFGRIRSNIACEQAPSWGMASEASRARTGGETALFPSLRSACFARRDFFSPHTPTGQVSRIFIPRFDFIFCPLWLFVVVKKQIDVSFHASVRKTDDNLYQERSRFLWCRQGTKMSEG